MKRRDLLTVVLQDDYGKPRPALVIQTDQFPGTASVVVLPVTSTLFSPGIWWIGFEMDLSGSDVQILQKYL